MKNLLEGLRKFHSQAYPTHQPLFEQLAQGQKPHTLLITCSDSRIDPNLITQTQPGEIFVVRNAGNIVPPYGASKGGEEATIEYGVEALKVSSIVVCGHSHCGAMAALMNPESVTSLPSVSRWLTHAESTRRRCLDHQHGSNGSIDPLTVIEENVVAQAENLKTHPAVFAALKRGDVQVFGWVYHFETGEVTVYDPSTGKFTPSSEVKDRADRNIKSLAI